MRQLPTQEHERRLAVLVHARHVGLDERRAPAGGDPLNQLGGQPMGVRAEAAGVARPGGDVRLHDDLANDRRERVTGCDHGRRDLGATSSAR